MSKIFKVSVFILVFFLLAIFSSWLFSNLKYGENDVKRFEKVLNAKSELLDQVVQNLFKTGDVIPYNELKEKGLVIAVYRNDTIYNWTDNEIQFPFYYDSLYFTSGIRFSSNTWYVEKTYHYRNFKAVGFVLIKKEFSYQNRYLRNSFYWFDFPPEVEIISEKTADSYPVNDIFGNYLFSLQTGDIIKYPFLQSYLAPIFYFISFLLILYLLTLFLKGINDPVQKNWALAGFALVLLVVRFIQTFLRFPQALYETGLFSPLQFANSEFLPSLGDLFLNTIVINYLVIRFNYDFYFPPVRKPKRGSSKVSYHVVSIVILVAFILYSYHVFKSLIINSSISFEAFKITGLNFYSIVGLIITGLQFVSVVFLTEKIAVIYRGNLSVERVTLLFSVVFTFFILFLSFAGFRIDSYSILFFFFVFLLLMLIRYRRDNLKNYSVIVILIFLFSVYSVYFITKTTDVKERQDMKILAETVSSEHDPVTELLLEDMGRRLNKDSTLSSMLFNMDVSYNEINRYLQNTYFNGYLSKYNFQFFDCRSEDSVYFEVPEKISFLCYPFFEDLLENKGMQLPNSGFYYIDNMNGRVNYLGRIRYTDAQDEMSIFIEMESKFLSERLGYPELLLNENYSDKPYLSGYSYSKYHKNVLIARYGNFHYSLDRSVYGANDEEFVFLRFDHYDHLIYNLDKDNSVIISKPVTGFFNMLVSFSYIFVFYYLLLLFVLISFNIPAFKRFEFNFKNKIQFSIISILLLSLILVGGGTIYFSIEQYQKKNYDNISEKLQSVYVELDHKLAYEQQLTPEWSSPAFANLDQLLINLSDVFYSDINLYSPNGELLATSRPEIFDQGLLGTMMNPMAYITLIRENKAEFIHKERIGKQEYVSAYVPFINADNKVLAFINLPYFTKQDELRKEITNLSVAVINIYVLLILLTVAVAVLISDTITKPLSLLQQKFGQIKLLRNQELIEYDGSDEVAGLVAEYNRMVQELQKSAELLARSERESAWREMAKQVAHEIKNPLTPMKLTIQHLQRAWKDKKENYAEIQEKVTRTLIEQIDNLSKIASEFSNFAKMPKANNERFNLSERIKDTIELFSDTANVQISFSQISKYDVYIDADKEQVSQALINLLTNAIQSIPEDKPGKVMVTIEKVPKKVIVMISDNGKGIPEELTDKLFVPNFTTKSSGMGLGLAITKNIIEAGNGTIRFNTKYGEGTTFIIEFPAEE